MAPKSKKNSKTKITVNKLSQSKKELGKGELKKIKGGLVQSQSVDAQKRVLWGAAGTPNLSD